jgi:hypothetical protein
MEKILILILIFAFGTRDEETVPYPRISFFLNRLFVLLHGSALCRDPRHSRRNFNELGHTVVPGVASESKSRSIKY